MKLVYNIFIVLFASSLMAAENREATLASDWIPKRIHLLGIDVTGGLALDIPLSIVSLQSAKIPLFLSHTLKADVFGDLYSVFECCQLNTFIRPLTEDQVLWKSPNGGKMVFRFLDREPSSIDRGFRCTRKGTGKYEILCPDKTILIYEHYRLTQFVLGSGEKISCQTAGGNITAMSDPVTGNKYLEAEYVDGFLSRLTLSNGEILLFGYTNEKRQLQRFWSNRNRSFSFDYANGVLSELETPSKKLHYAWQADMKFGRKRMILIKDQAYTYSYQEHDIIVRLSATPSVGPKLFFAFNELTGRPIPSK